MDEVNRFLQSILLGPDDLLKLLLGSSFFPGMVLALFLVYKFVSSWLGFAKNAAARSRRAAEGSRQLFRRLTRVPGARLFAGVIVTGLVVLLSAAWLGSAIVIGNILQFAYHTSPGGNRDFLELPTSEMLSRVDLLGYSTFSAVYVPLLVALLAIKVMRPDAMNRFGVWVANLPLVPLVVVTAFVVVMELVLDVLLVGAPMSKYPALGWQAAFLGVAAVYSLASMAAFSAVEGLRAQWSQLLDPVENNPRLDDPSAL